MCALEGWGIRKHYFRKGKDPEPDPDPYLWLMDLDFDVLNSSMDVSEEYVLFS